MKTSWICSVLLMLSLVFASPAVAEHKKAGDIGVANLACQSPEYARQQAQLMMYVSSEQTPEAVDRYVRFLIAADTIPNGKCVHSMDPGFKVLLVKPIPGFDIHDEIHGFLQLWECRIEGGAVVYSYVQHPETSL